MRDDAEGQRPGVRGPARAFRRHAHIVAERRGEAFKQGQILIEDDLIVALTEFGELVLVEATPTAFRELGRIEALRKGSKTWNTPALDHGRRGKEVSPGERGI